MHKHRACVKLYCVLLSLKTDDHIVNVRFPTHHLRSCIFLFFGTPRALSGYVGVIEVITHWCFTQHFSKFLPGSHSLFFPGFLMLPNLCLCLFHCLCRPGGQLWLGAYHEFILWHYSSLPTLSNRSLWVMSYSAQALSWYIFAWGLYSTEFKFSLEMKGGKQGWEWYFALNLYYVLWTTCVCPKCA